MSDLLSKKIKRKTLITKELSKCFTKVTVTEYECNRCNWKFIRRKNGKDMPAPKYCPHCKSNPWDAKRVYTHDIA
jgi:predicted Zn-ribbon and HTH transcriptional regulator